MNSSRPFHCHIVFHCRNLTQFTHSTVDGHFSCGLFLLSGYCKNVAINVLAYVFWWTYGTNSLAGSMKKDDIYGDVDELPDGKVEWLLFRSLLSCPQNLVTWRKGQQIKSHPRVVSVV